MPRPDRSRWFLLLAGVGVLGACADDVAGPNGREATPPAAVAPALESLSCPATAPTGYTVIRCFQFTTIPGVFHGFGLGPSVQPTTPGASGQLSGDYLLLSPTGTLALSTGAPLDVNLDISMFQSEFNGFVWNDVFRLLSSALQPPQTVTIAIAKREPTPITSTPCPPAIPAGYQLVTCFPFTTLPGTWHGFIVGGSTPPAAPGEPGQLAAEYELVSPSGLPLLVPGAFLDVNQPGHTFQAEFNGTTWNDVFRLVTPLYGPARPMTIAIVRRERTPALQIARLDAQVEQLAADGTLSAEQAEPLGAMLENAARLAGEERPVPATALLRAFTIQVRLLMSPQRGVLSPEQGTPLVELADAVIARLRST